jgi:hypothetical protein
MAKETWLLGSLTPRWDNNILPSSRDVLKSIYYLQSEKKWSHSEGCVRVSLELENTWNRFGIEKMTKNNILVKVKSLLSEFKNLMKSKKKTSESFLQKKDSFIVKLDSLFDISVGITRQSIKSKRVLRFLEDQSTNRCSIASDFGLILSSGENEGDLWLKL